MQVKMEAHSWTKRFRFPGYDGALPKAVRSLRGRGKYQQKVNKPPSDWGLFELLATVAGQILQEKNLNEEKARREHGFAKDRGNATVNEDVSQVAFGFVQCPPSGLVDKPTDSINKSKDVQGVLKTSKDVKKLVNKEGFEGAESGDNQLNLGANVPFVDSKKDFNIDDSSQEGTNTCDGILCSESRCTLSRGTNLEILDPEYLDLQMHSEVREASDTGCCLFRGRLVTKEGSCMTMRDPSIQNESPSLLSSGRSEGELTSVHTESCDIFSKQASEKHLDIRQKLVCNKAKDDDDNFSVSVVPKATPPQNSLQASVAQKLQQKTPHHGLVRVDTSVTGSKRKFFQTIAKDASIGCSPSIAKAAWRKANKSIKESHDSSAVKVNITSFRVPELSIDLPKTATVANLKRAVMDAAINLLGGGLHVRVLHGGEKISDESATLVQMGISSRERLDSLAFMLEPDRITNTTACVEDPVFGLSDATNQSTAWYPVFSSSEDMDGNREKTVNGKCCVCVKMDASATRGESNMVIEPGRGLEPHQCIPDEAPLTTSGGPLILHPGLKDTEVMDLMTAQHSFRGISAGKRRTRRPFTVIEVAALVQAVELFGTGRWREVKQQAFDSARHRTYVDLKDKWKTLVHTAHISPHQRRGEPVPQELLDRVLKAHTYWAAQHAKQQAIPGT